MEESEILKRFKTYKDSYINSYEELITMKNEYNNKLKNKIKNSKNYKADKKVYKEELVDIRNNYKTNKQDIQNKIKDELNKSLISFNEYVNDENKKNNTKIKILKINNIRLLAIIIIPVMMSIGLFVSYFVVNQIDLSNSHDLIALGISITLILFELALYLFLIIFSYKKTILDYYNNSLICTSIGFTASFFDTLGVGSFATNTGLLKAAKYIKDDKKLPGTLNIGMAIPNLFSGILFMTSVQVDIITLLSFVLSAVIGSIIGSTIVNKINKKLISLIMGIVLAITTLLMLLTVKGIEVFPSGTADGVSDVWWKLMLGCIAFIILGMFISFGIGLYAPAMAVISLLGINFLVVFPIMTCCSGLTMHINSYRFYKKNNYMPKTSLFMTIGGITGVIISYIFVFYILITLLHVDKNIITDVFKWLSVFVIAYSSFTLLRSYYKQTKNLHNIKSNY
ncbi:sulfite exporter TauE/SafE family protein [Spiroplasma turonicum]|uniref:Uncharacterized protein n=1 Tax=Spiroplasma turonicum TaxID=216946 RepID=A0A0K1P669_9MOLU|nr:sulfite exporter TauE/SafE family protein [Spiroplasma turonicum]AKU79796.1 hypothetical protein STURON_00550 [Spiroplasma turonicum]ALX70814.1 hypothetical protein STURO_v1c05480 [Spiroplasma turonicum]